MSLTKDDLNAIKDIVETAIEDSKQHAAAGFAEVHQKIDKVNRELADKIETVQTIVSAEVKRLDQQSTVISKMRKTFKAV